MSDMTTMTTIELVEPDHYEIIALFSTGIANKFRVIADSEEEAIALIRDNIPKERPDPHGYIRLEQVFCQSHRQECHTTFVKAFTP